MHMCFSCFYTKYPPFCFGLRQYFLIFCLCIHVFVRITPYHGTSGCTRLARGHQVGILWVVPLRFWRSCFRSFRLGFDVRSILIIFHIFHHISTIWTVLVVVVLCCFDTFKWWHPRWILIPKKHGCFLNRWARSPWYWKTHKFTDCFLCRYIYIYIDIHIIIYIIIYR